MGIPTNMFTVMFTLGRLPGWIAQWLEMRRDPDFRIGRPRQVYVGATKRLDLIWPAYARTGARSATAPCDR